MTSQNQIIESLQPYLTRIAHNLVLTAGYCRGQDPDELLQIMNLAILEQAENDPTFLQQKPGYISRRAAWAARDWAKREAYGDKLQPKLIDRERYQRSGTQTIPLQEIMFPAPQGDLDVALAVREILSTLEGLAQQVAELMLQGWKQADIARELGIPKTTVNSAKNRVRAALAPVWAVARG